MKPGDTPSLKLGLDVGGTKCAALVGTTDGEVIERIAWPSAADRGPEAMIEDLVRGGRELLGRRAGVASAGVSIGGPLDSDAGVIHAPPNLPGWDAIPLKAELEAALGLPVSVMHDAAACALAEARWGVGRDLNQPVTLAFLTCGTGMGAGLVLRGQVWVGAGGRSPELGHVRLTDGPDDPEAFGKRGCVEAWCAGAGLPGVAAAAVPARWGAGGTEGAPEGPALSALASAGDADALAALALHARMTGRTAAILGDLLVPEAIVLGSLAPRLGERWLAQVRATFVAEVLPAVAERCRVVPAALGDRLQDLAALAAAG